MTDRLKKSYRFSTVPEHLIRDKTISDRAMRLWCLLDRYAGANGEAFPLRRTLAGDLDCSLASLDRALAELVDHGWLSKERREQGGPNDYTLLIAKEPPLQARRRKRDAEPSVTGDATPAVTSEDTPLVTSENTVASQETTGVVTDDAHKEESPKEESGKEPSLRSGTRAKPKTLLPEDFDVTDDMKAWFAQQPWASSVARPGIETQNFMDHHRAKGSRFSDWKAAWRTWMRNAGTRYADNVRPIETRHSTPDSPDRAARVAAMNGGN